ncbi:hypothetical protein [Salegentibacter flavus]|uniref:Tetratricopeptide repeat-containing protein n=1 Tax=Salegentibacter flavus TaxID=287099 RepID=A0A1I5ALS8_9FLAO|nr:hypothetical protein [Salegentibacter flavus]SFN63407.1 hypothetical protein SAMN05660413_01930 [Salegentibacter flavus]
MEKQEFIKILEQPASITEAQTRALESILAEAPYFQTARALRLKGLKDHNALSYNSALRRTAAYTTDRSVLFDFITSAEFNQNKIAKQIKEQEEDLKNIVVYEAQEVFGKRSIAIDEAIKMKKTESERVMDPGLFQETSPKKEDEEENETSAEEQLGIGDPLEFNSSESHSFSEWLKLTSAEPVRETEKPSEEITRKFELIDEFISKSPKIKPGKTPKKSNLAERSITSPEALMTETLAKVYLEQKNYIKAIQAYKILILKNPEKSGFFADQIRAIEKLQENNNT